MGDYGYSPFTGRLDKDSKLSQSDIVLQDTENNILGTSSPTEGQIAYATDTQRVWFYTDTDWRPTVVKLIPITNPNMGAGNPVAPFDYYGFYIDMITNKILYNCVIGTNTEEVAGALRFVTTSSPQVLQVYADGAWNTLPADLTYIEGEFRHTPITEQYTIHSGDSVRDGLNGIPLAREYQMNMGSMGSLLYVGGREVQADGTLTGEE